MKINFSIDIAILTTMITIFLYASGYFYLDGLINFFGYTHSALGFSFQDYLVYGWVNGMLGTFLCILSFIIISFMQNIYKKEAYKSFLKFIFLIFSFVIFFLYKTTLGFVFKIIKWIFIKFIKPVFTWLILYTRKKNLLTFIELSLTPFFIFFLLLISGFIYLLKSLFGSAIEESSENAKKFSKWNFEKDHKNIEIAMNELISHYFYMVIFYLIFLSFAFYVIKLNSNAEKEATIFFNNTQFKEIIIQDDVIDYWLKVKNFNIDTPVSAKLVFCGSAKCLIAIPSSQIMNVNHKQISAKNNYYVKLIEPSNFIQIK